MLVPSFDPVPAPLTFGRERRETVQQLQQVIDTTLQAGMDACHADPALTDTILPLLARLRDIRQQLEPFQAVDEQRMVAELHPALLRQLLESGCYMPWGKSPPPANSCTNG